MDEDEYEEYLDQIDEIDPLLGEVRVPIDEGPLDYYLVFDRVVDDKGHVVPGCYRRKPLHVEYE